jgi:hypothetical protein
MAPPKRIKQPPILTLPPKPISAGRVVRRKYSLTEPPTYSGRYSRSLSIYRQTSTEEKTRRSSRPPQSQRKYSGLSIPTSSGRRRYIDPR